MFGHTQDEKLLNMLVPIGYLQFETPLICCSEQCPIDPIEIRMKSPNSKDPVNANADLREFAQSIFRHARVADLGNAQFIVA